MNPADRARLEILLADAAQDDPPDSLRDRVFRAERVSGWRRPATLVGLAAAAAAFVAILFLPVARPPAGTPAQASSDPLVLEKPFEPRRQEMRPGIEATIVRQAMDVSWSPDGKLVAAALQGGAFDRNEDGVKVWDAAAGREVAWYPSGERGVSSVRFLPDGRLVFLRSEDNRWTIVDPRDPAAPPSSDYVLKREGFHRTSGTARIRVSPDGRHAVTTGVDNAKILWRIDGWKELAVLEGPAPSLPTEGSFSPDGALFAAAGAGGRIRVWEIPSGEPHGSFPGSACAFAAGAFVTLSPDGGELQDWGWPVRQHRTKGPACYPLPSKAWSLGGGSPGAAVGLRDGTVEIYRRLPANATRPKVAPRFMRSEGFRCASHNPSAEAFAFDPAGARLAVGRLDGSVTVHRLGKDPADMPLKDRVEALVDACRAEAAPRAETWSGPPVEDPDWEHLEKLHRALHLKDLKGVTVRVMSWDAFIEALKEADPLGFGVLVRHYDEHGAREIGIVAVRIGETADLHFIHPRRGGPGLGVLRRWDGQTAETVARFLK